MAGKPALSFGFAKKAEPKRHVAALSTKKVDDREEIRGVEEGQVAVEKPKEGQGPPVIKCKNPLDGANAPKKLTPNLPTGDKPKVLDKPLDECGGGIVSKNLAKLSDEDAEAMRELLKDAAREGDGDCESVAAAVPILMKEGSKKVREGSAPEATKEMFENMPVESFGEALLRGMGYDPKVHTTTPIFRDKLRDSNLGLGAKALLPGEKAQIARKRKAGTPAAASGVAKASAVAAAVATNETAASAESSEPAEKRPRSDDAEVKAIQVDASPDIWASRGLVVKVISKQGELRDFFGVEAVVLEVDEGKRCCRIKARPNGSDKSQQLKGVSIKDLETRVSRDCEKVKIVRGPKKGVVAKLAKRDSAKGIASLQIDGTDTEMSLDDVCQFMG